MRNPYSTKLGLDHIEDIAQYVNSSRVAANLDKHSVIVERIDFNNDTAHLLDPFGNMFGQGIAFEGTISIQKFRELQWNSQSMVLIHFRGE